MEDAGVEIGKRVLQKKLSRRQVLKGLVTKPPVVIALASGVLNKLTGGESKAQEKSSPLLSVAAITGGAVSRGESVPVNAEKKVEAPILFEKVFHNLSEAEKQEARKIVERMKRDVLKSNSSYEAMLAVTRKFEQKNIRQETAKRDILTESGIGIIFVENGGGDDKIHPKSGARGVAQLMEETARQYGMIVAYDWKAGGLDERADPAKSIKVMAMYLRDNKGLLAGDEGLAIWSYHAGIGNVMWALRNYFLDYGIDVGDYSKAFDTQNHREMLRIQNKVRELILEHKVNVHKVLTDPAVAKIVLPNLDDESEWYVYKAVAAAELFDESAKM